MSKIHNEQLVLNSILSRAKLSFSMERLENILRVEVDLDKLLTALGKQGNVLMENTVDSVELYIGGQIFRGTEDFIVRQQRESQGFKHVTS